MRLRTFFAPTMEEALSQIRRTLGSEAMIISSLNEGERFRVTAACDRDIERDVLEKQNVSTSQQLLSANEMKSLICNLSDHHRLPQVTTDHLFSAVVKLPQSTVERGLGSVLENIMQLKPFEAKAINGPGKRIMLVGPSGAGKTLTLAKIAVEYVLTEQNPVLITCDSFKAGAAEQLKIYANALGVMCHACPAPEELEALIKSIETNHPNSPILIDTPGINIHTPEEMQYLTQLVLAIKIAPIMLLPAGLDAEETIELCQHLKDFGCTKLIVTRMDTVRRYGGILSALLKENLDLYAMSAGPEVGSRLHSATANNLCEFLLAPILDKAGLGQGTKQGTQIPAHHFPKHSLSDDKDINPSQSPDSTSGNIPAWLMKSMENHA